MFREAHALWQGGPYAGQGTVSTASRVLSNAPYALGTVALKPFTTPYELLAASLASSMAVTLAQEMARLSIKPSEVDTHVALMFDDLMDPEKITSAHLRITARSHNPQSDRFQAAVEAARRACAIWNALKLNLTCEAELISAPEPALL